MNLGLAWTMSAAVKRATGLAEFRQELAQRKYTTPLEKPVNAPAKLSVPLAADLGRQLDIRAGPEEMRRVARQKRPAFSLNSLLLFDPAIHHGYQLAGIQ